VWAPRPYSLGVQQRQAIKQQVGRAWRLGWPRSGSCGLRSLPQTGPGAEPAGVLRRGERFQISLAGKPDIERFETRCGLEQQR